MNSLAVEDVEIRTNLFAQLTANPGVRAIVKDRIHPVLLPQGVTIPAISYQLVSEVDLQQAYNQPSEIPAALYQINCWDTTAAGAVKLKGAVKMALNGNSGWWEGADGKRRVYGCIYKGQRETVDPAGRLFCRQVNFRIVFK